MANNGDILEKMYCYKKSFKEVESWIDPAAWDCYYEAVNSYGEGTKWQVCVIMINFLEAALAKGKH